MINEKTATETPVLIDVTRLILRLLKGRRATGVDRVGLAYLSHYRACCGVQLHAVLSWGGRVRVMDAALSQKIFDRLLNDARKPDDVRFWRRQLLRIACFYKVDRSYAGAVLFNTGHKGVESSAYVKTLQAMGVKPVYFVHDLIPLTFPEYCRPDEEDKHAARMCNMLAGAAAVVVNSDDTKRELLAFADKQGLPCPPVQTAWLASCVEETEQLDKSLPGFSQHPYFVMLGTIEARKNHLLLLHVWRSLVEELGVQNVPRLVIIGQRGWECEQVIDLLDRAQKLKSVVAELNTVADGQLSDLLAGARALLFPSFAEGFGMPLVEALELGVPVIASDIPVFREIGQGVPDFADPLDGIRWRNLILAYADPDSDIRRMQIDRMVSYRPWTWRDHFKQVDLFLRQHRLFPPVSE